MVRALKLAIDDLGDRRVLAVLGRTLLITLLLFAGAGVALAVALDGYDPCGPWLDRSCTLGPSASGFGALLLTVAGLWFLFPAVALGVVSGSVDHIVVAVEARHYPEALAARRRLGWAESLWLGLRASLRLLLCNLVALPFYILLMVTGIGPVILFLAVNGLAIGRGLGEMIAVRHGDKAARRAWLADTREERAVIGVIVAGLFLLPVVNLLAPVIGAAMVTHLYHSVSGRVVASG